MPLTQQYKHAYSLVGVALGIDLVSIVMGWPWDLFGAAVAGATVFLFAEAAKATPTKRTLEQKIYCVLVGWFFGSILGQVTSVIVAKKLDVPEADVPWVYAGLWGAFAYQIYAFMQKRVPKTVTKVIDKVEKLTENDESE